MRWPFQANANLDRRLGEMRPFFGTVSRVAVILLVAYSVGVIFQNQQLGNELATRNGIIVDQKKLIDVQNIELARLRVDLAKAKLAQATASVSQGWVRYVDEQKPKKSAEARSAKRSSGKVAQESNKKHARARTAPSLADIQASRLRTAVGVAIFLKTRAIRRSHRDP